MSRSFTNLILFQVFIAMVACSGGSADAPNPVATAKTPTVSPTNQPPAVTPGANSNDTGPTQSTPVLNCNTALFPVCDGFETAAVGGPPDANHWTLAVPPPPDDAITPSANPNDNYMRVSSDHVHRGSNALHIHAAVGSEHVVMQDVASATKPSTFLPAPNETCFVRYWFYFDGTTIDSRGHMYMVNASGPLAGKQQYEKFGGNVSNGAMDYSWVYFGPDTSLVSSDPWPTAQWTCFETEYEGSTGELHVWVNDAEVTALHSPAGKWAPPAYNRLTLGFEHDDVDTTYPAVDVYVDDVAYSYQRIGCTN